ncbi:hypothetical protein D9758_010276 [Tetrapyrgos nigripes]|uniref:DUF6534 domain-containing protein n=1 Tax=Tetrapyrgos nigripes TaxID=182062 RepID=A0A8H5GAP7_9AGAR|nr:hypothetical protein D9758_010276 [Tetrapyrgos nigripes]
MLGPAEVAHGPFLIGTFINILLYGISITQVYLYWNRYQAKDRWFIKAFVTLIFTADTVQTIFVMMYSYISLVKHFDDVEYLATARTWLFSAEPALAGIIGGMVQAFYAWRVKVLTGSWILVAIILVCSAACFLMGIATAIACNIVKAFVEFQKFQVIVIIWLVSATVADIIITATLVTHLRRHRTGFKNTDSHVDRIIRMSIQTGLLTSVWALVDLLVFLLDPTGLHLLFNNPLAKLYTNSLLSSLNSRGGWKFEDTNGTQDRIQTSRMDRDRSRGPVIIHVEEHEMTRTDRPSKTEDTITLQDGGEHNWHIDTKERQADTFAV